LFTADFFILKKAAVTAVFKNKVFKHGYIHINLSTKQKYKFLIY
jgi:hypothetical protein